VCKGRGNLPATVKRNESCRGVGVELDIQGCGMRREMNPSLLARSTICRGRGVVRLEESANLDAAAEIGCVPGREARRVAEINALEGVACRV
jgi:hypothetical protein